MFADVYDHWYPSTGDDADAVAFIASLDGRRPVLELGVGTGRLACPLALQGVPVWGIDCSAAMTAKLSAKPGGPLVRVLIGDIAVLPLPDDAPRFGVVFAAFNTLFLLNNIAAQLACLRRAGEALAPNGSVVVEAFVPTNPPAEPGGQMEVSRMDSDRLVMKWARWSESTGTIVGRHVEVGPHGMVVRPWEFHPLSPDRLDSVAGEAGLSLRARYGGWDRSPFERNSRRHISIYCIEDS